MYDESDQGPHLVSLSRQEARRRIESRFPSNQSPENPNEGLDGCISQDVVFFMDYSIAEKSIHDQVSVALSRAAKIVGNHPSLDSFKVCIVVVLIVEILICWSPLLIVIFGEIEPGFLSVVHK